MGLFDKFPCNSGDLRSQRCHKQPHVFRDVRHSRRLLIVGPVCHQYPKRRLRLQVELWAGYLQSCAKAVEFYISLKNQAYLLEKLFWILGELWDVMKEGVAQQRLLPSCYLTKLDKSDSDFTSRHGMNWWL